MTRFPRPRPELAALAAGLLALTLAPGVPPAAGGVPAGAATGPAPDEAAPSPDTLDPLRSGPMVGYSTMREVALWVQTDGPARVRGVYWDTTAPDRRFRTRAVETRSGEGFTAHLVADSLKPGRAYRYTIQVDGREVEIGHPLEFQTQELWQWRRGPPDFTMALGSCAYINESRYDRPGEPYGSDYRIFGSIHRADPDFMLWLGDNTYLREADWNSWTGILHRYTHTRSLPELQPLLGSTHHYAIWDDHDYGPNNSDRSFWMKESTLKAFRLFWANPNYGVHGGPGITGTFRWSDVRFFLLDNRYHRTPNDRVTGRRTVLGEEQLRWLVDALASSRATFKVVVMGGQFLNPTPDEENYANVDEERRRILEAIRAEDIRGVVFLSGDLHYTELSRMERPGGRPLYELTVSPLTAGVSTGAEESGNVHRVEGTLVTEHNFALVRVHGPRVDRRMTVSIRDADGREIWERTITARELGVEEAAAPPVN